MRIISILLIMVWVALFLGCDKIEEPYLRDGINGPDTSDCPVPEFPPLNNPVRKVMLEDYTGHKCVNCPAAAVLARDIREDNYPDVVVVAVHAGFFATPYAGTEYDMDFRTQAGTDFDNFFKIGMAGNPNGMVDRTGYDQNHILGPANWKSNIEARLALPPGLFLQIINEYDEAEKKLCTHIKTNFLNDWSETLNLSVFIIEDSIQAAQANNDPQVGPVPDILDYWHMHVLRGAVNGSWGKTIAAADTVTQSGHSIIKSYGIDFNEEWKSKHCSVVAFVYKTDNYEVIQVAEAHVINE